VRNWLGWLGRGDAMSGESGADEDEEWVKSSSENIVIE
jgi:hypothetical protein